MTAIPAAPAAGVIADTVDADASDRATSTVDRDDRPWGWSLALAVVVGACVAAMFASHRSGHWWGDDWALYLRQAEGLLHGHPNRVLAENEFAVTASRGSAFSPPLYPWGFPLLLVPFVAVLGTDVDRLAIVPVLCSVVFAVSWYALAHPRVGRLPALVGVPVLLLSPLLFSWTELIQSEWPFLAVTAVVLVALDRFARLGTLADAHARVVPLALLGVGVAAAFTVRREGLAMVAAVAVAQLVALHEARDRRWWAPGRDRWALAVRLATPHAAALAVVWSLQVLLPSTLVPQYSGTGLHNVWEYGDEHVEHLAEVIGLKRAWDAEPMVLGSERLGTIVVLALFVLAFIGIGLAIVRYRSRDLHLVAYAVAAFLIGASFRVAINRYVCTVAPIVLLMALVGTDAIVRSVLRRGAPVVLAVLLSLIVAGNVANANIRIDRARVAAEVGAVEWGPTHPDAVEMFEAVEDLSDPSDVVAAPKARAMTLETGRWAVQVDDRRPVPTDVDLALIVVETNTELADELAMQPRRYELVWYNARFAIFAPV